MMRAFLLALTITLFSFKGFSQTILHTEDFESGSPNVLLNTLDLGGILTGENPWTINDVYLGGLGLVPCIPPLPLLVPPTPLQPPGITNFPNSTYLHVTPQSALDLGGLLPAASYMPADGICLLGGASTFSGMSTDVNTIGQDSVTFDLWWICGGSDLYYGEVYYSTNSGADWTPIINPLNGTNKWIDQLTWTNTVLTDPNWENQATLRFGFRFISGTGITGDETFPGFGVDDIRIIGHDVCTPTASTINPEFCFSYTSPSGNYVWTESNTYQDTIQNVEGCDSLITINLLIHDVDVSVTQNGVELTSNEDGASYQWLDCSNGHVTITVATNQTFAPLTDGEYAVEVTSVNGCIDTSGCFTVAGVGYDESSGERFVIHPNPAHDQVIISTAENSAVQVVIADLTGKEILRQQVLTTTTKIALQGVLQEGIYVVQIRNAAGKIIGIEKLVIF